MSWFSREPKTAESTAERVLRDGLVQVLESFREGTDPEQRGRIGRVIQRLHRSPPPAGLGKELEKLNLARALPSTQDTSRELSATLHAVVEAMRQASLIDVGLVRVIDEFRAGIPRRVMPEDVAKINEDARKLRRDAARYRERAVEDREELARLLQDLNRELGRANNVSAQLDGGLTSLADSLREEAAPEHMRAARRRLIQQVRVLAGNASELRRDLGSANRRSSSITDAVSNPGAGLIDVNNAANQDELTGLLSRKAFDAAYPQVVRRSRVKGQPLAIALLDLDRFRDINDLNGRVAGDAVLQETARQVMQQVREGDLVARWGGEELALVLPGAGRHVAQAVAERIRFAISKTSVDAGGMTVYFTVSIGLAQAGPDDDGKRLFKRADAALFKAKSSGRNMVVVAEE